MKCRRCNEPDHPYGALFCHMCGTILEQSTNKPIKTTEKLQLNWAESFSEGFAFVVVGNKAGFIDKKGRFAIKPKFNIEGSYLFGRDYIKGFSNGLAIVSIGNDRKYGCIDYSGNFVIQPKFDGIWPFAEGLAPILLDGGWGYIDTRGQMIIEPKYRGVSLFSEGLAAVSVGWRRDVFINKTGQIVLEKTRNLISDWEEGFPIRRAYFNWASSFHDGLARVGFSKKHGYIDKTGKFHRMKYDNIDDYSEGLAAFAVEDYSRSGYIDRNFNVVIAPQFIGTSPFHNGLAVVKQGKHVGYIDKTGRMVIPCQFDNASPFNDGLAAVEINKKIGYIDFSGKIVIPPRYNSARKFSEGLAAVEESGEWRFIDKSGKYVF